MTEAHEQELASFPRMRAVSFLASKAGDPAELLAVDLRNELDTEECWAWLKMRGFGQVHGVGRNCEVEEILQKPCPPG